MNRVKNISIIAIASIGVLLTLGQMLMHLRGKEICFNQGCKIVEGVLALDPLVVNGAGALFFLTIIFLVFVIKRRGDLSFLLDLLLLCAFVAEGLLLSIQLFIAHTFCSYCLLIASLVLLVTISYRGRIAIFGMSFVTIEMAIFSFISLPFQNLDTLNLNQGTYAVKTCSNPGSVAFLIFSENCPHCKKVLSNLQGCVKCEIHFNPVSKIKKEVLPGLIPIEGYEPQINLLALKIFDINSVPVLIQRTDDGYKIIKGDEKIIEFIHSQCFCPGSSMPAVPFLQGQDLLQQGQDGVCSLDEQCK